MSTADSIEAWGREFQRAVARACREQEMSRDQLADKLGCSRSTLYSPADNPSGIGFELLEGIAKAGKLSTLDMMTLIQRWVEARVVQSEDPIARAMHGFLQDLERDYPPDQWLQKLQSFMGRLRTHGVRRKRTRGRTR